MQMKPLRFQSMADTSITQYLPCLCPFFSGIAELVDIVRNKMLGQVELCSD